MSLEAHVTNLKRKHSELEDQISQFSHRPSADPSEIATLKKRKLQLKDKIEKATLLH
jgi:hypothetical protein